MKGDNINALCNASLSSPLRKKKPFPTLLLSVNVLPLSSWFRVLNHILIAWRGGLGPINFAVNNWSLSTAMQANKLSESALNEMASFLTRKPLKLLSRFGGSTYAIFFLNGLSSSSLIYILASTITASVISVSRFCTLPAIHPPFSSIIGSNLGPPP